MKKPRRPAAAALVLVLSSGLLLSACGEDPTPVAEPVVRSATEHNQSDVDFASDMIQHHAQALVMVDLAVGRDLEPEVLAVVETVREVQAPEIETMVGWLRDWDEEVPATMRDHVNAEHGDGPGDAHADDVGAELPGMANAEALAELAAADDEAFAESWLELMIAHHEGAVQLASAEEGAGQFEPAVDLAATIVAEQTEQLTTLRELAG